MSNLGIRDDTHKLILFLNALVALDRAAMEALVLTRVLVTSEEFMHHPTVQCLNNTVGFLGVVNGYCGAFADGPKKGWGPITAVFDE